MITSAEGLPDRDPTASIARTTSMPSATFPKTTCLPSSHDVLKVQMKNWEPLLSGPEFAMERIPGPVCLRLKFSSANDMPLCVGVRGVYVCVVCTCVRVCMYVCVRVRAWMRGRACVYMHVLVHEYDTYESKRSTAGTSTLMVPI